MLTLYEKRIQMTGVLNLAVVVYRLPRIKYQTIHPKPTEKDGGEILIRCHSLYTCNNQDGFRNAQLAAS